MRIMRKHIAVADFLPLFSGLIEGAKLMSIMRKHIAEGRKHRFHFSYSRLVICAFWRVLRLSSTELTSVFPVHRRRLKQRISLNTVMYSRLNCFCVAPYMKGLMVLLR